MFQGRMQKLTYKVPVDTLDAYNHKRRTYERGGMILINIVPQDRTEINTNDLDVYTSTLVGYTENNRITIGCLINDKYLVTSIMPHRTCNVLYLQEIEEGKL